MGLVLRNRAQSIDRSAGIPSRLATDRTTKGGTTALQAFPPHLFKNSDGPKSGDPGCDHEGGFVHGQPPQHLHSRGRGRGVIQTGRALCSGGDWGGRALHVYLQTRHVYVVSRIIRNFGTRHRSRLPSLCKYASGHLLYPFLANLYLGSG